MHLCVFVKVWHVWVQALDSLEWELQAVWVLGIKLRTSGQNWDVPTSPAPVIFVMTTIHHIGLF